MGFVQGYAECYGCRRPFFFHPRRVPSITIDGDRIPICLHCVERVNPQRVARGLAPIVPLPGAYEPMDEREMTDYDGAFEAEITSYDPGDE